MPRVKGQLAKERKIEAKLDNFKLIPSLKPPLFHTHTVRNQIESFWGKKLRPHMLDLLDRTCSTCGWRPADKQEERKLHLHEIEEYDFQNMVVHLVGLELICTWCHAFHHIARTKIVTTDDQWKYLQTHFCKVNNCDVSIFDDWDLVVSLSLQRNKAVMENQALPLGVMRELSTKVRRFTISDDVPFASEIRRKIAAKGVLYRGG